MLDTEPASYFRLCITRDPRNGESLRLNHRQQVAYAETAMLAGWVKFR